MPRRQHQRLEHNNKQYGLSGATISDISGNAAFTIAFSRPLSEFGITAFLAAPADRRDDDPLHRQFDLCVSVQRGDRCGHDDTFFGLLRPAVKKIASLVWLSSPATDFVRWDDMAFVVANFSPRP